MMLVSLKKIISEAGTIKISLSLILILAITFNLNQTLDSSSKEYIDKAFNRALISFGIAKSLNAVISVAQGTEIAIQPAGIGINLTPGQVLDPVNDLVERFSWIMLMSSTSLGVQKVFLTMSIWQGFNYFLIAFLVLGLVALFVRTKKYLSIRKLLLRAGLILIVLRFAVPITGLASQGVYQLFLEKDYVSSNQNLEHAALEIEALNNSDAFTQPDIKKKSVWESAKDFYNSSSEMFDINNKIVKYKQAATETTKHIISLIVVFLFQTIIIPLVFFLVLYATLKYILRFELNL